MGWLGELMQVLAESCPGLPAVQFLDGAGCFQQGAGIPIETTLRATGFLIGAKKYVFLINHSYPQLAKSWNHYLRKTQFALKVNLNLAIAVKAHTKCVKAVAGFSSWLRY